MTPTTLRLVLPAAPLAAESTLPWPHRIDTQADVPPASLIEARALRDALEDLLARERTATADVILALSDFDHRRGWEALGHASLFAFLHRELRLSKGAAYLRLTAARLVPRFQDVEAALRDGRLCLSAVGELSRVLTPENEADVLPRFFGCSSREAREVAAALAPRAEPPRREVVTAVRAHEPARVEPLPAPPPTVTASTGGPPQAGLMAVRAHEPAPSMPCSPEVRRPAPAPRAEVEPLDADLRRLHLTVSRGLLDKVAKARDGLSHSHPGATTEQVLEAALDLLLEQQARRHALVKRPRAATGPKASPPRDRSIPAAVEREVRLRDENRCQAPLDAGGICGSTHQLELDHVIPVALGGPSTPANLRLTCAFHNRLAARRQLGAVVAEERRSPRRSA